LLVAAAAGNIEAQIRVFAVEDYIHQIEGWKPPARCFLCGAAEISRREMPAAVVLLSGHREGDRQFAAAGVCVDCASEHDFRDRLAEAYRRMMPGLRLLPIFSAAGHA
jgi:hypothetical protein